MEPFKLLFLTTTFIFSSFIFAADGGGRGACAVYSVAREQKDLQTAIATYKKILLQIAYLEVFFKIPRVENLGVRRFEDVRIHPSTGERVVKGDDACEKLLYRERKNGYHPVEDKTPEEVEYYDAFLNNKADSLIRPKIISTALKIERTNQLIKEAWARLEELEVRREAYLKDFMRKGFSASRAFFRNNET
jgi:hypothetical protein